MFGLPESNSRDTARSVAYKAPPSEKLFKRFFMDTEADASMSRTRGALKRGSVGNVRDGSTNSHGHPKFLGQILNQWLGCGDSNLI